MEKAILRFKTTRPPEEKQLYTIQRKNTNRKIKLIKGRTWKIRNGLENKYEWIFGRKSRECS